MLFIDFYYYCRLKKYIVMINVFLLPVGGIADLRTTCIIEFLGLFFVAICPVVEEASSLTQCN